ncbi:SNF2 family DNA or RNA helicase [Salirhabdus euzebyi]|uniref:SNF2 family DNA or RNA helicase n=1 Tax=Salirhabdus euzebyi TaxID=394506 RepID=A0A841PWC4_9BACI|nr:DEAD/DEAH box helicase [Salirhabdus euzebyi]MBB6451596.1 SNF2 family DNA or RNA helicase [Salirhabdus euzebyi]
MQIRLNKKVIQERCGAVSYKKGDAFYRNGKVTVKNITTDALHATVKGTENFQVQIEKNNKEYTATCSCPSLSSYQKDCQHIAAVLIAWQHHQVERNHNGNGINTTISTESTDGLLQLIQPPSYAKSSRQIHFENRKVLPITFVCKVIAMDNGKNMLGIELQLASHQNVTIREFLENVRTGNRHIIKQGIVYDPMEHCFDEDTDAVLQQLMLIMLDEKMYERAMPTYQGKSSKNNQMLLIPVSAWKRLEPLLVRAPQVYLEWEGRMLPFQVVDHSLPLLFKFTGNRQIGYSLFIDGLSQLVILTEYDTVLYDGKMVEVKRREADILYELKRMIDHTSTNEIPIPTDQLNYYMEKLVPSLRKLGEVHLAGEIAESMQKTPLHAKLYLDRVKNRLLAGVEFHYDSVIINPLDHRNIQVGSFIIRDMDKEEEILQLMEESKFSQTDSGYFLQNEALEYHFLYHQLLKLQKMTSVYATTAVRMRITPKSTFPKLKVRHKKERTNWLGFTFEMEGIKDEEIKEVLTALEEKRKYYRLRDGALLSLETKEMEEIKQFLQTVPVQDDDVDKQFEVPIVEGLRILNRIGDSDAVTLEASFREFLSTIHHPEQLEFDIPAPLKDLLRPYQRDGFKWLKSLASYGFGGILADDMGLGKTIQSIAFILSELPTMRERKQPALIVCPSSVTYNWENELMKFAPDLETLIVDGNKSERMKLQQEWTNVDVIITSYPLLRSDTKSYERLKFHVVFFDEAQVFKNPLTQTARVVKKVEATHRFALTGTPMENALEELWSIFHVVFPELFLGLKEFSELTNKQIARRIRPFMLRRVKEDVLSELPEKKETTDYAELLPAQKKLYTSYLAKLRHDTLKHLDRDTIRKNRIKILAGLTRLRQICCHPALFVEGYQGGSAKFQQLKQMIEESKLAGRRVLIFSQFTKMLQLIGQDLVEQGIPYFYLDGQTNSEERVNLCNRYNQGERDIFLISLKAGGTGLNLTGADTVIFYDSWWNPAVEQQAADRAHRMGQKHAVQVIKLVAKGTIEEKMNALQEKKQHLIEEVIDPTKDQTERLTEEDLRELLK